MADSSRTQMYYSSEATWGAALTAGNDTLQTLRFTGESLSYNLGTTKSVEIRSDRQTADLIQNSAEAGGDINFELSYSTYDDFLKAALYSAGWSTTIAISSATIAASETGNVFTSTDAAFATGNVNAGQWIEVRGFTDTASNINGYHLVTAVVETQITVASTLGSEALGDTVTIGGSYLRNGTTESSFFLEKAHSDITQFFKYSGMVPNVLNLSVAADSIVTGSFSFTGKAEALAQATGGDGSPTAATTTAVMNAVANVGQIMEGSTLSAISASLFIQSIDFSLTNNIRPIRAIGSLPAVDLGVGSLDLTGTMNTYFLDNTLFDKFLANTDTGLSFKIEDTAGNAYIFTFHRVKFSSDTVDAGGIDQDVMENIGFTSLRHATYNCMIQVDKFAA